MTRLTSVGRVSEEALKINDNWPGWRPDNKSVPSFTNCFQFSWFFKF